MRASIAVYVRVWVKTRIHWTGVSNSPFVIIQLIFIIRNIKYYLIFF